MTPPKPRRLAAQILPAAFLTPRNLTDRGLSRHGVSTLVRRGLLLRIRNGRYAPIDTHPELLRAGTLGGRLDCVSLLRSIGVFVHSDERLHVQIERGASRLPPRRSGIVAHWRVSECSRTALAADLVEALVQACRCQPPRLAIATLDSAWHHGLVDERGIAAVFRLLPRRYARIRGLLERRSESGPETIMRLMLRGLGCRVDIQVSIPEVGRVDFVVDGWLIIECDSKAHHEGWDSQKRDRRRDLAAAALGFTTIRPLAEDILYRPEDVLRMLKRILQNPGPPRGASQNSSNRRLLALLEG
ncbi:DUF559 domain-containing protein [Microbacterium sp. BWT-B31]|uniref:endonuclease domain-containing protein n=1 Tax=Microbacterium sp. BWT-B31 TaxID=3232072 RepID=UPI003529653A